MARQRRLNEAGAYHHITARGVDRCDIFLDDHDRRQFLSLLSEARQRFGCQVLAFCLMTNHVHLTVRDSQGTLSKTQHFLNGVYAKRFNHKYGRSGHLFERRFWSSVLDSDAYLTTCAAYVHRNPLQAGMVSRLEDYQWSSYPSYLGLRSAPDFLDTTMLLNHYANDTTRLRADTEDFAEDRPIVRQLQSPNPPRVLGPLQDRSPKRVQRLEPRPSQLNLDDVIAACAKVSGVSTAAVTCREQGRRNPSRSLTIYVAHRHAGFSLKEIGAAMQLSPAAVSAAHRRFATAASAEQRDSIPEALRLLDLPGPTC